MTLDYAPNKDVAGPQQTVKVNERVLEYQTLIVPSQLKLHETATVTLALLGGQAVETGIVIASTDALAADAVGARLLGFTTQAVRRPWEAEKLGIGEADTDRMDFPEMDLEKAIEAFTEAAYGERLNFEHA